jgi:hypothetical protein
VKWDQIKGKWIQFRSKAKEQWGNLATMILIELTGNRDQRLRRTGGGRGSPSKRPERTQSENFAGEF